MKTEAKLYLTALHWACLSTKKLANLQRVFSEPKLAWYASERALRELISWPSQELETFLVRRRMLEPEQYWEQLEQLKIVVFCPEDPNYPENLRYIYDPPPILYLKGKLAALQRNAVAIVGARKASSYGLIIAEKLARSLAEQGITVISGLARGIDAAAHRGALAAGYTAAVLACGLDMVYPKENTKLMQAIAEQGILLSEHPLGTPAAPWGFPIRNRIISGLSLGVLVVEAEEQSGSLITVDSALEQGRDVFAVPGNIFTATSKGPHKLIKQGAKLVTCAEDIIEELGIDTLFPGMLTSTPATQPKLNPQEKKLLKRLALEPQTVDSLAEQLQIPAADLLGILTFLEIRGLVKQLPGQYFMQIEK